MIPSVELVRLEENFEFGTFGILRINKEIFCCTLEPRDEENRVNISSIPAQQYICKLGDTGLNSVLRLGLYKTFEVMNVPGRTNIKIHPGNSIEHTEGCILLGEKFAKFKGDRMILNSGRTFLRFMDLMTNHPSFHLTVKEDY